MVADAHPYHVSCWGSNAVGQLGNATHTGTDLYGDPYNQSPSDVIYAGGSLLTDVTAVSAGSRFNCALLSGHTVVCWGSNDADQLGDYHTTVDYTSSPVGVYEASGSLLGSSVAIVDVESGKRHACALDEKSGVFCWGDNTYGQLGTSPGGASSTPTRVDVDVTLFTDDFDGD